MDVPLTLVCLIYCVGEDVMFAFGEIPYIVCEMRPTKSYDNMLEILLK